MQLFRHFHASRGTVIKSLQSTTNSLKKILRDKISAEGPISFSSYMDLCLSHPDFGYYNKGKIFGKEGDFITSPEISQVFGESLAVWCATIHSKLGGPQKWHIVEIGPGRGTLASDLIRVLKGLKLSDGLSMHLIDQSSHLKKLQQQTLLSAFKGQLQFESFKGCERYFNKETSLYWYSSLTDMTKIYLQDYAKQPVIIIGHEIFDALPIHIFEFTDQQGWCEVLIDVNSYEQFEIGLSKGSNEAVRSILRPEKLFSRGIIHDLKHGDRIELSPASIKLYDDICELLKQGKSASLMIDYGDNRAYGNSVRGIKNHEKLPIEQWIQMPGDVDISAYVDFAALKNVAKKHKELISYDAIPQGFFLETMGISARIEMLSKKNPLKAESLTKDYERLVSPEAMGEIYKCLYTGNQDLGEIYPFTEELSYEKA